MWSEHQLLEAYRVASALVGWDPAGRTDGRTTGIETAKWRVLLASEAPTAPAGVLSMQAAEEMPTASLAELDHFVRRAREALGIDAPRWALLRWQPVAGIAARAVLDPDGWRPIWLDCWSADDVWIGEGSIGVSCPEFKLVEVRTKETLDACKAALYDALVQYQLRMLRVRAA